MNTIYYYAIESGHSVRTEIRSELAQRLGPGTSMAQSTLISSLPRGLLRPCAFCIQHPRLACFLLICVILLLNALSSFAQTSQSVYASVPVTETGASTTTSQVVSFTKSSAASLSLIGAPAPSALEGGPMAIDSQGLFLFVLNPTSGLISMYQINQTPGLTEVPGSPFAASTGGVGLDSGIPVCIATEKSGHFLYVGFNPANPNTNGEIIEYAIVAAAQQIQMDGSRIETPPGLVDCVTDQQNFLYVGLKGGGTNVYTIGQLEAVPGSAGSGRPEVSIAVDPQGRYFLDGWGGSAGFVESAPISPANGTATNVTPPLSLGSNHSPTSMLVDGSGKFLYVTETGSVYAYQIDGDTSALTPSPGPPTPLIFERATSAADPQGPYIYSLQDDGVHVFEIGPEGALGEILGSPSSTGSSGAWGLAVSGTPGQAATGAIAQLFPPSQDFGSIYVGQASGTKSLSLTNTGGVGLNFTAVAVSGANASDFVGVPIARCRCSYRPAQPATRLARSTLASRRPRQGRAKPR
jgi:6-phosphogluconolactonase (cycloisomerase 2 family)